MGSVGAHGASVIESGRPAISYLDGRTPGSPGRPAGGVTVHPPSRRPGAAPPLDRLLATLGLPSPAAHAAEVAADLRAWATRFPVADPRRFGALALTTAVHLPGLSRDGRALAARLNAWIYAFDDLVDGVPPRRSAHGPFARGWRLTDAAVDRLVACCLEVVGAAGRGEPRPAHPLPPGDGTEAAAVVEALAGLVGEVAARPSFAPLAPLWSATFSRMLDGIVRERRLVDALADGAPLPSPAAHLETGRYSIGAPHYLATCFVLHAEADDPGLLDRLPALWALALAAADVARLANDLCTWVREEREGTFNSVRAADLALARVMPRLPAALRRTHAVQAVERLLATARERVHGLATSAPSPLPAAEAGIVRLVDFVPALYATADFHAFGDAPPLAGHHPGRPQAGAATAAERLGQCPPAADLAGGRRAPGALDRPAVHRDQRPFPR